MSVSLYALGSAKIEIGRYGMSLNDAYDNFLKTAEECGAIIEKVSIDTKTIKIKLDWDGDNNKLLHKLAFVQDLHGDPPYRYTLEEETVHIGQYVQTGCYND